MQHHLESDDVFELIRLGMTYLAKLENSQDKSDMGQFYVTKANLGGDIDRFRKNMKYFLKFLEKHRDRKWKNRFSDRIKSLSEKVEDEKYLSCDVHITFD